LDNIQADSVAPFIEMAESQSDLLQLPTFKTSGLFYYLPGSGIGIGLGKDTLTSLRSTPKKEKGKAEESTVAFDPSEPFSLGVWKKRRGLHAVGGSITSGELYDETLSRVRNNGLKPYFG
jgi:hypothetical protein